MGMDGNANIGTCKGCVGVCLLLVGQLDIWDLERVMVWTGMKSTDMCTSSKDFFPCLTQGFLVWALKSKRGSCAGNEI